MAARDRAALAGALDPIITIDAHGVIQSASNSVERVFGWTPSELVGRNVNVLMPEPHHLAHDGYLANYRRTGRTNILGHAREFGAVRRNGERFPIELSVSRVDPAGGALPLFVGLIRDISEPKRLERELRLLKDLALVVSEVRTVSQAHVEVLRLICEATGWDHGEVWTLSEGGDELIGEETWSRADTGLEQFAMLARETRLRRGESLVGRVWESGRADWIGDTESINLEEFPRVERARQAGMRTAAAVPVLFNAEVKEVLLFFGRTARREDLHLLELVRAAVVPLATMIERKRADVAMRESEARSAKDLRAMRGLHELVLRLLGHTDIATAIGDVLDSAITMTGARMGHVQLLDSRTNTLSIAVQRGFQQEFLDHFLEVRMEERCACGRAFRDREHIVIEDVQTDPDYVPHREVAATAGYRAVQSIPLVASNGHLLGVLSTHFARVHRPPERELRMLDLYARQAADFIVRLRTEKQLDEYNRTLETKVEERSKALSDSQDKLRMADRLASIGTLAAGLGHDMNNVLLPVRAHLNVLKVAVETGKIPTSEQKPVNEIHKSVAYLQQLADGLHFLAMDPDTEEDVRGGGAATDLHQWWQQAGPLLSKAVPRHVRVVASFPKGLPCAGIAAHGLTQAILNLVVNAGEAIPADNRGRRQGCVRLWAETRNDKSGCCIRIGVSDNGSGMSDEVMRRAFEMFYTSKPRGMGTGLGLALVHKIADRAGGHAGIESVVGKGTTVTITVPAAKSANGALADVTAPIAVISVTDSRGASIIEHMLSKSGILAQDEQQLDHASIWVVDPELEVSRVNDWRSQHQDDHLVLFGKPTKRISAWKALKPIIIENTKNFEMIRTAIGQTIQQKVSSSQMR